MALFEILNILGITILAPLLCSLSPSCIAYYRNVAYYISIIKSNTARAYTYPLPQDASSYQTPATTPAVYGIYNYIVVGASASGSVIASRLSEDPTKSVLLLEVGGNSSDFSNIPGFSLYLQGLEFNYNYNTTPQANCCLAMINSECPYPTAKGLGGYTLISAPRYERGNKRDYNTWCQGNAGWCYEDALPEFIKAENSKINGTPGYHGVGGPMNVEYLNPGAYSQQYFAFIAANQQMGIPIVDYNGPHQSGVSPIQFNIINGVRESAEKAYLRPAANRPNLKILTFSYTTKILFLGTQAYGVTFTNNNLLYQAYATQEVIVASGAIRSAQLLMQSGIGPESDLTNLGIPVVQNLSVGENLQNPVAYYPLNFLSNFTQSQENIQGNVEDYLKGSGVFTVSGNQQGVGFYQTNLVTDPDYPDVQLIMVPSNNTDPFVKRAWHYTDASYAAAWGGNDPTRCFSIYVILPRPKSRGNVKLSSNNAYSYPIINPRSLSDPDGLDILTIYKGIQLALQIVSQLAFQKLNASLINNTPPACQNEVYLSQSYWYCCIRQYALPVVNTIGTCKMGPDPLQGAVVDNTARVHGVIGLRVADGSIIPACTTGDFSAPLIMLGENVADIIKSGI